VNVGNPAYCSAVPYEISPILNRPFKPSIMIGTINPSTPGLRSRV
jgi:hypothetical protein